MLIIKNDPIDTTILFECIADKKALSFIRPVCIDPATDLVQELITTDEILIGEIDAISKLYDSSSLSLKNIDRDSAFLGLDGQYGLHHRSFYDPEKEAGNYAINEKRFINYNNIIKSYFATDISDSKEDILARMADYQVDTSLDAPYIRDYVVELIRVKLDESTTPEEKQIIDTYKAYKENKRYLIELAKTLYQVANPYDPKGKLSLTKIYNCAKNGLITIRKVEPNEILDTNYPKSPSPSGAALAQFITSSINISTQEILSAQRRTEDEKIIESIAISDMLKGAFSNWIYDTGKPPVNLSGYIENQVILTSDAYDAIYNKLQAGTSLNNVPTNTMTGIKGILENWRGSVVLPSNALRQGLLK